MYGLSRSARYTQGRKVIVVSWLTPQPATCRDSNSLEVVRYGLALPRNVAISGLRCVNRECWKSRENEPIFAYAANLACIAKPFVVFIRASIVCPTLADAIVGIDALRKAAEKTG
jgi:hypothetical protein